MKSKKMSIMILSIVALLIGIMMLIKPGQSMDLICMIIGVGLAIGGVVAIISAVRVSDNPLARGSFLTTGIVLLVIGVIFLSRPAFVISLFPLIFGVAIAANGVVNLINAFKVRVISDNQWMLPVGMAILTILLGVVIIFNPFKTMAILTRIIGAIIIYNAISTIFIASKMND